MHKRIRTRGRIEDFLQWILNCRSTKLIVFPSHKKSYCDHIFLLVGRNPEEKGRAINRNILLLQNLNSSKFRVVLSRPFLLLAIHNRFTHSNFIKFRCSVLSENINFKTTDFLRHLREYFVTSCVFKKVCKVSSGKIKFPYFFVCVNFWAFLLKQKTISKVQNFWGTLENILWHLASLKKCHQQKSNFPIFLSELIFELYIENKKEFQKYRIFEAPSRIFCDILRL